MSVSSLDRHIIYESCFIESEVSLADKNWFGTGGAAAYFVEPADTQEMRDAVRFAREHKRAITILGAGANVLISDDGVEGLVIKPDMKNLSLTDGGSSIAYLTAGAGATIDDVITYCLANHLLGLEEFSGIPGTIGGAVYINLHYFEFLLSQFLVRATVLEVATGDVMEVDSEWFAFGYNTSTLHAKKHILLDATFRVYKADAITDVFYAQGRRHEIMRHRERRYPTKNTCGSFFRNFYEHEVEREVNGRKAIWIAYYLDKIGVKGQLRIGGASVSHQHANMIVNDGSATTADIIAVARKMQKLVHKEFGVLAQPECRLIGFKEYPLMG